LTRQRQQDFFANEFSLRAPALNSVPLCNFLRLVHRSLCIAIGYPIRPLAPSRGGAQQEKHRAKDHDQPRRRSEEP
jgi:hypothetical protein